MSSLTTSIFLFFNDTATTEIYTLSLHDALPILRGSARRGAPRGSRRARGPRRAPAGRVLGPSPGARRRGSRQRVLRRSEEHTSELQSRQYLVCRLLLEKNNNDYTTN